MPSILLTNYFLAMQSQDSRLQRPYECVNMARAQDAWVPSLLYYLLAIQSLAGYSPSLWFSFVISKKKMKTTGLTALT
jgi:NADH:ubiquinone oxidoreductase subunit 3 (subunit A)